jgi:hypothetical protein
MHEILVRCLDGIPAEHQQLLYDKMKGCSTTDRLLVCLYFMSDLPWHGRHLDRIEQNLRRIFPPALRTGYLPDDYVDFQASAIRFLFDREPFRIKKNEISEEDRLWESFQRGYWSNTAWGNQRAVELLAMLGVVVTKSPPPRSKAAPDHK